MKKRYRAGIYYDTEMDQKKLMVERIPGKQYYYVFYPDSHYLRFTHKRLIIFPFYLKFTCSYTLGYYEKKFILKGRISQKTLDHLIKCSECYGR